ncbi:hypothetical protein [Oceanobacillus sp. CFH 90083]|uniref:hypothetical protein n=1 Tax=Oceanobacillus sp. CFH 90083 TaxID=2592336 RepID=UPI00128E76CE|nr:hypothetical protein [Oceanobacillus sp. CFH 90083]
MQIIITGINFNYDDGFDKECTSVNVNYITRGFDFILDQSRPVNITHEQYEANKEDKDKMRSLVIESIIADATKFIDDVAAYRDSLT